MEALNNNFIDLYSQSQLSQEYFIIQTLGCRTNSYESIVYESQLKQLGWKKYDSGISKLPALVIINTCSVTHNADTSSNRIIKKMRSLYPNAKLVVTGCLVENTKIDFCKDFGVDIVVSNLKKEQLLKLVYPNLNVPNFELNVPFSKTRAHVKIQDGCDEFCRYCIIPYVRGRSRSRKIVDILNEIRNLIKLGYKEVVLTGINIGDFNGDEDSNYFHKHPLSILIDEIDALDGIKRIRLSSIDPDDLDYDIIDSLAYGKHTTPWMHLVAQSGSNVILKEMGRKYTVEKFIDFVTYFRKNVEHVNFSTDIIVGFPGESKKDFELTCSFVESIGFSNIHVFPFSSRPRTRADRLQNKIGINEINKRKKVLLEIRQGLKHKYLQQFIGRDVTVLVEKVEQDLVFGYTHEYLPIYVRIPRAHKVKCNSLIKAYVRSSDQNLMGDLNA